MKKNELNKAVIENIKNARSVNDLINIIGLKSGGGVNNKIKEIIKQFNIDISHFGGKIIREKKYKEINKECIVCKKKFMTKEGHVKEQKYCSKSCSNRDRIISADTAEKIRLGVLKNNKLSNLSEKYGANIIGVAMDMRLTGDTYLHIKKETQITDDDLKMFFNVTELNFAGNNINSYALKKEDVLRLYGEVKNIKKVAILLNSTPPTIRKYISDEDIIIRPKIVSKNDSVIEWRKRSKIKLVEYKGGRCECCGYDKSIAALQFHHKNPEDKDFSIGGRSYSFERLKNEVDKCVMVCANCHIEIHEEIREKGYSDKI